MSVIQADNLNIDYLLDGRWVSHAGAGADELPRPE
jgi:hypothetical protein